MRGLICSCLEDYYSILLLPYSKSSGALGSPGLLLSLSVITEALRNNIILIVTLTSFYISTSASTNSFVKSDRSALTSFFLAPSKLSIEECVLDETFSRCKRVILRDIVPVPIRSQRDDIESSLMAALGNSRVSIKSLVSSSRDVLYLYTFLYCHYLIFSGVVH